MQNSGSDNISGSRQHYIPASLIGKFSLESERKLRKRRVWIKRDSVNNPYTQKAENVGWERNMYTLNEPADLDTDAVDKSWSYVESHLISTIETLEHKQEPYFDLSLWATVLVPFVAQLFIRTPDYNSRFREKLNGKESSELKENIIEDKINKSRLHNFQIGCALVLNSEWRILKNETGIPFITNDIGYGFHKNSQGERGISVPLSKKYMVLIKRKNTVRVDITYIKHPITGKYVIPVPTLTFKGATVKEANRAMAAIAKSEIYGATERAVKNAWEGRGSIQMEHPGPSILAPDRVQPDDWIYEYWRFLYAMKIPIEIISGAMGGNFIIDPRDRSKFPNRRKL